MVAKAVKRTPTPAVASGQAKGKVEATKKEGAELERTFVCGLRVSTSHVLRTRHLSDSNVLAGGLRLQPQKSHVQMT